MRTLDEIDVAGRTVFVRVDFNVPLDAEGHVTDDARIRAALPTLKYLLERDCALVLASHLGRPDGVDPSCSLQPAADRLTELTGWRVKLARSVVGDEVQALAEGLAPGQILMLENVRFEAGETKNDPELAEAYAAMADVYVDDAFGASHRAHASNVGIVGQIELSAAGLLLQLEVETISEILADPPRPLVAIVGGSKVTDKIGVLNAFLERADVILIGGAMCFPFFAAQGHEIGNSLCSDDDSEPARGVLAEAAERGTALLLPTVLVIGKELRAETEIRELDGVDVPDGWIGLDIGPKSSAAYAELVATAGSVFWNGPMGAFEIEPFSAGTRAVAEAVAACPGTSVVGGGDSAAALAQFGLEARVTHLSTGGGATLELIEGATLPAVEALS